jgi:hypothetical protein
VASRITQIITVLFLSHNIFFDLERHFQRIKAGSTIRIFDEFTEKIQSWENHQRMSTPYTFCKNASSIDLERYEAVKSLSRVCMMGSAASSGIACVIIVMHEKTLFNSSTVEHLIQSTSSTVHPYFKYIVTMST